MIQLRVLDYALGSIQLGYIHILGLVLLRLELVKIRLWLGFRLKDRVLNIVQFLLWFKHLILTRLKDRIGLEIEGQKVNYLVMVQDCG